jgi:glycosyltransferase involved in cell wall biosynthesis
MIRAPVLLSVVIPLHNEQESLGALAERLTRVLDEQGEPFEAILVDDGSSDGTAFQLSSLSERDPRFRVVTLSRNFGHQIAITAGLDRAVGDAVVVMDGDLQDPPEVIPKLLDRWREGYDVVYAVRQRREGEPMLRRMRAAIFYRFFRLVSEIDAPVDVGDFRLIDRRVLLVLRGMPERHRYLRGMVAWVGLRQTGVEYVREERFAGQSKYPLAKLLQLGLNGVISFSDAPLRLALRLGLAISALAFFGGMAAIVVKLAGLFPIPGTATIVVLSSFLGGVQLLILGILGLYLGRIYDEVKGRPLYVVDKESRLEPSVRHPHEPEATVDGLRE